MLNKGLLNTTLLNNIPVAFIDDLTTDAVRFNTFGFYQDGKIIIDQPQYDEPANLIIDSYKKPLSDGFGQNSQYMGIKKIRLKGILKEDDSQTLEALIDQINDELNVDFGNLDIKRADGSYRRFKAKAVKTSGLRDKHYHDYWCDFTIDFDVYDGYGQDIDVTSSGNAVSSLSFSGTHICDTVGKKIKTPADFIIAVSAGSGITKCNIKNETTGDEIEFDVSVVAGDFIYVTGSETECYKLSSGTKTPIKPRGRYITLAKGENNYTITFTGTSVSYENTVKHINLYV